MLEAEVVALDDVVGAGHDPQAQSRFRRSRSGPPETSRRSMFPSAPRADVHGRSRCRCERLARGGDTEEVPRDDVAPLVRQAETERREIGEDQTAHGAVARVDRQPVRKPNRS